MTENKQIINVSEASYAFYNAGIANGRVEAIKNIREQLTKAANGYNSLVSKLNIDEVLLHEAPIQQLVEIIQGFDTLPDQISNQLEQLEVTQRELLDKALKIEKRQPYKRISNAISGLIDGWNR